MAYTYRVSANALRRIQEAVVYLENVQQGFGMAFDAELQDCMTHICEFPEMAPPLYENRRKAYLSRFKYHIVYSVHHDRKEIVIHTVVHHSREQGKWKEK